MNATLIILLTFFLGLQVGGALSRDAMARQISKAANQLCNAPYRPYEIKPVLHRDQECSTKLVEKFPILIGELAWQSQVSHAQARNKVF
jgi:hypothetical protein